MKKVIVSSKNPVKIAATEKAFAAMFPTEKFVFEGVSVASGVSDQPMTDDETFEGAKNRAENALHEYPDADYWVGIEGGVENVHDGMTIFGWMAIRSKHKKALGKARTASFYLPKAVSDLVNKGLELGDADDKIFGDSNSKQKNGSVGLLTGDVLTREDYYVEALIFALIPFISLNKDLY